MRQKLFWYIYPRDTIQFKMKKITHSILGSLFLFLGTTHLAAQDLAAVTKSKYLKVKKHTVMEQFEPEMVLSVKERVRLKEERMAIIEHRRGILDTLQISERRRQKLLKELINNPFSDKLGKAVAEIEFIGDEPEN